MPRYFFNLRYGYGSDKLAVDPEGDEFASLAEAHDHALEAARDLIARTRMYAVRDWFVCSFEIEDESCRRLLTVPFNETVSELDEGDEPSPSVH